VTEWRHLRIEDQCDTWLCRLMTRLPYPKVPPEQMTPRARLYLLSISIYCLVVGATCVLLHPDFVSPAFNVIKDRMPFHLKGWAGAQITVGLISFFACWRGDERFAWFSLIGSAIVSGLWATWFIYPLFVLDHITETAQFVLILLGSCFTLMTALNLVQARQPLRSPFEPILRSIDEEHD
jgi:hypothetical protein